MKSKSILITGITSGLGSVVLQKCLNEQFQVTGVVRNKEQQEQLGKQFNTPLDILIADLSKREEVKELSRNLKNRTFDYILLNAGCGDTGRFHKLTEDSIDILMEANLLSNMRLVYALLPDALEHKSKIVFVSSLAARMPGSMYTSYCVSKAGLSHFYSCIKREYPSLPLLCIEIGAVNTPMHKKSKNTEANPEKFRSAEEVGDRLFKAMKNQVGIKTLYWQWGMARKIVMMADQLIVNLLSRKA